MTDTPAKPVVVEFTQSCLVRWWGPYSKGEVAAFPVDVANQLMRPNPRTGKVFAKPYLGPEGQ